MNLEPPAKNLSAAAVLIPILRLQEQLVVALTKRAEHLKHHPGQVSFAGGRVEDADPNLEFTALREAEEEMGLPPALVQVLGRLPSHRTVTNFEMTPVVGWLDDVWDVRVDKNEVQETFFVPLSHLSSTANFVIEQRAWFGHKRNYYAVPFGPYYIWGATARILFGLAQRLEQVENQN